MQNKQTSVLFGRYMSVKLFHSLYLSAVGTECANMLRKTNRRPSLTPLSLINMFVVK